MLIRPMLAPNDDPQRNPNFFKKLQYPLLCSPKLDGIRGLSLGGKLYSRSGKLLPSRQVQEEFKNLPALDGELIEGDPKDFDVYNRTQSHVMSEDKPGNLTYWVFDCLEDSSSPFYKRLDLAESLISHPKVRLVPHEYIDSYEELLAYEEKQLDLGYEGIMMRSPIAPYKHGRCTMNEGYFFKLKRFSDTEGVIVGFEERMTNTNKAEESELGYTKRSSSKEGLRPAGTLGKFLVSYREDTLPVALGSFKHSEAQEIWDNQDKYLGLTLKFRYFGHGVKDRPRFPRAIGFRSELDL